MRAMAEDDGMRWLIGPRLQRRFGVWINVLARVLMQTKPEPFVAQVQRILDASDELRDELHTITAPTLVITGSQDTLTPVGDAEELAELIPTSRLYVLSGAAHGLMAETPNAFNDAVLRFLDEVDAEAAPSPRTSLRDLRPPRAACRPTPIRARSTCPMRTERELRVAPTLRNRHRSMAGRAGRGDARATR